MNYTITHNHDGSITISTVHNGIYKHRLYIGYTEKQAERLFCEWLTKYAENEFVNQN